MICWMVPARSLTLAVCREPIDLSDRRPAIHRRLLDLAVATAAEPRAVARQPLLHQRLGDVDAPEAADRHAAIIGMIGEIDRDLPANCCTGFEHHQQAEQLVCRAGTIIKALGTGWPMPTRRCGCPSAPWS
jgi:hypothetical protein